MNQCPKCNQVLEDAATSCSACGWILEPTVVADTVDFPDNQLLKQEDSDSVSESTDLEASAIEQIATDDQVQMTLPFGHDVTVDFDADASTSQNDDFVLGDQAATVRFDEAASSDFLPQSESQEEFSLIEMEEDGWNEELIEGTLKASDMNPPAAEPADDLATAALNEESLGTIPIPAPLPPTSAGHPANRSTDASAAAFEPSDRQDTLAEIGQGQSGDDQKVNSDQQAPSDLEMTRTLDVPPFPESLEDQKQPEASDDSGTVKFLDSDQNSASIATVGLAVGGQPEDDSQEGTVRYSPDQLDAAMADTGRSTPSGHLRRVWGQVGGSSANPMNTLKVGGALATDSVFERVSPRILVAPEPETIIQAVRERAKDKRRDPRLIEDCLQIASSTSTINNALPDYQINGYIGQGAMGVVFQGRQVGIGRDVAIKMIQPSPGGSRSASSTRDMQKKFLYEAQITGKLDHPNIVPVYELGISNNVLFYTMKKIVGTEWKDSFAKRPKDDNVDILMKVADAMAFAHQRNIIHRDLKPENVMLGPFGEVLVVDWGCAVDLSLRENFAGAGSPPWMAPEMALHDRSQISTRSDIYLLGAILYQIVVGHPPHAGRSVMEVLQNAAKNSIIQTNSSDPLLKIALRAMETRPQDRFGTVEEMQDAIRLYQRHAESIALSDRSKVTLEQAITTKEYERFSRSIFGFQEALDLWPDNAAASEGLRSARFAYGQLAFDKRDFDLCLGTLDLNVPDEKTLYVKAEKAKRDAQQQASRNKLYRKVIFSVVSVAASVFAVGFFWILRQNSQIQLQSNEIAGKNKVISATNKELDGKNAELSENIVTITNQRGELEKTNSQLTTKQLELNKTNERLLGEKMLVKEKNEQLTSANEKLVESELKIREQYEKLRETTAATLLGQYQSVIGLAQSDVSSVVAKATASLQSADEIASEFARTNIAAPSSDEEQSTAPSNDLPTPLLKNWAWNRINLLSNSDLVTQPIGEQVTALALSQSSNRGVVALTRHGGNWLHVTSIQNGKLAIDPQLSLKLDAQAIETVSISPDGQSVLYSLAAAANQSPKLFRWQVGSAAAQPIANADMRAFQGFVATDTADVAGLNRGLWVWNRNGTDEDSQRIEAVQGRLLSMQLLQNDAVLVLAEMPNGQRYPHIVSLPDGQMHQYLRAQQLLGKERLSAIAYAKGRLVLGTESGKLFSLPYALESINSTQSTSGENVDRGVDLNASTLTEIPQQHNSRIKAIKAHADGTLLTIAEEPQVNLWRPVESELGWSLDIRLTGTPSNVRFADFGQSSQQVLALANDTRSIVWDVNDQRLRQRVQRIAADGSPQDYAAPVVSLVTSEDGRRAVSVLADGTMDRWNVQTGQSEHNTQVPLAYIGHAPNAQFVDMSIDASSGIMITSARLPLQSQVSKSSAADRAQAKDSLQWDWEFVKWDLQGMKMIDRWYRRSGEEQAVSLLGRGRYVLYGSDRQTQMQSTADQSEFLKTDFGSFFGVTNPKQTNLVMLVKLNGALQMVDVDNLDGSWRQSQYGLSAEDFRAMATSSDRPIIGQWSPAGDRFYLIWESGRVTELSWDGARLALERDLRRTGQQLDVTFTGDPSSASAESNAQGGQAATIRIASRWNVDMKVRSTPDQHLLYALVRFPGRSGLTRLTRIAFPVAEGEVQLRQSDTKMGSQHCVLSDDEVPQAVTGPLEQAVSRVPSLNRHIAGLRTSGQHTYIATRSGTILRVGSQQADVETFGRPRLLSATGDRTANTIFTLHEGGILWRADWQNNQWNWRQMPMAPVNAKSIKLSPDGSQLAVLTDTSLGLYSADSGTLTKNIAESTIAAFTWDRHQPAVFALVGGDGVIRRLTDTGLVEIARLPEGTAAKSIHFFNEAWNDPAKPIERWLLVHTTAASSDQLHYFKLDAGNAQQQDSLLATLSSRVSAIECSPVEGLIAVGGYGTVAIYFAAPTLGEAGKELFSLSGHAGADVNVLQFTADGSTLLSGDRNHRMFGWLSADSPDAPVAQPIAKISQSAGAR